MTAAAWATAIATFLAVLVALRHDIASLWRRPRLRATIRMGPPDCHKTELQRVDLSTRGIERTECFYLRLWVENIGPVRAEQVQVFVAMLEKQHADGAFRVDDSFLPMNLKWSHAQPGSIELFTSINPHMGRHLDLGHVVDPADSDRFLSRHPQSGDGKTTLELDLEVAPNTLSHLLPPGTYRITLSLAGANVEPVQIRLRIVHTGNWYSDERRMLADGFAVAPA